MAEEAEKLRGRFARGLDRAAARYVASISFDWRLYKYDILGSVAHARMLGKQGIITGAEAEQLIAGLNAILKDIEAGKLEMRLDLEDIHMNIESILADRLGDVAGKLHTARSRNDQVALDMRLFVKDAIKEILRRVRGCQEALVKAAEAGKASIMPGYTHLQRAQPVLFAHHLLAYFEMYQRDAERLRDCLQRVNILPLGSGALAGVSYPIDRDAVARELGFSRVSANSLDAVSDRDFVVEFEAAAVLIMLHTSRLAEELILWSSAEFGLIDIDEAYATGSSIMPQKKNADVAELARAKTGRVVGDLVAMITTLKGLPLAYNRDLQEDKEGLFDAVDTVQATLEVVSGMVATLRVNEERARAAAAGNYALATDVADYLVGKGLTFRQSHNLVGKLVQYAAVKGRALSQLSLEEYRQFSPLFDGNVLAISADSSVAARNVPGGTAPVQVEKALARAKEILREQADR